MTEQEAIEQLKFLIKKDFHVDTKESCLIAISALEKQIDSGWVKCSERLPECEEKVWIQTKRGTRTTAMYEDGKMSVDNSIWNWNDIDFDYNEETDTYFIPKGWWEYKHFAPDDVYNYAVDEEVIVWQPLPKPYQESEERNDWI